MPNALIPSFVLSGATAHPVEIEVGFLTRLPAIVIAGVPQSAGKELGEIVRSAIEAAGFELPRTRIVVNVKCAIEPRDWTPGSVFALALPIAVGILVAAGHIPHPEQTAFLGAMGLGGDVRAVRGALAAAWVNSADRLVVPRDSEAATLAPGQEIRVIGHLSDMRDRAALPFAPPRPVFRAHEDDTNRVRAEALPAALLVQALRAVRTRKPLLLVGDPGTGKTRIARDLVFALGAMTEEEWATVALVHEAAGLMSGPVPVPARPFRAPHHTVSGKGLVGDAHGVGEYHLAVHGVLFLDEVHEFARATLEGVERLVGNTDRSAAILKDRGSRCDVFLVGATIPQHADRVHASPLFRDCPRFDLHLQG